MSISRIGKSRSCGTGTTTGTLWPRSEGRAPRGGKKDGASREAPVEEEGAENVSDIEIEHVFPGMRPQVEGKDLVLHLVVDPGFDHVRRKDIAFQEIVMVVLQGLQDFPQRPWCL